MRTSVASIVARIAAIACGVSVFTARAPAEVRPDAPGHLLHAVVIEAIERRDAVLVLLLPFRCGMNGDSSSAASPARIVALGLVERRRIALEPLELLEERGVRLLHARQEHAPC